MTPVAALLRRLVAHWPLKLASLALAVLLWALVSAEQVTMHWIPVQVEPEVRDPRYVVTDGPAPREVSVLFAGPGRLLWQLALERPVLVLPVREPERGGHVLDATMLRFPEGVRNVAVRDIRPAVVRLEVQPLSTREVPLQARYSRGSSARYLIRGTPVLSPSTVRVTGPASDVDRLEYLETEPIELATADSATFDLRVRVDTVGLRQFRVSPSRVRVRGELDLRAERMLTGVPVVDAQGQPAGVADLRLAGPLRVLRTLGPEQVRVEATVDGQRIRGLPATVSATVVARRAALGPPAEPQP